MNEITLSNLFDMILRRIWIVVISIVLCAALAFSYCSFIATPVYKAEASILTTNGAIINNDIDNTVKNTDLAASIYLVDTCVDVLKSPKIFQDLSTAIGNKYSYRQLMNSFTISRRGEESLFIDISFKSTSMEECQQIVNTFAELSSGYISEIIPSASITVMAKADSVSVVSPRTLFTTVIFAVLGAAICCAVIFLHETMDKAIKGEEDIKAFFDVPILGVVPSFETSNNKKNHTSSGGC